ncbi:uncharacterized protein LY89DRAFT_746753 [Mollisia scopiformis]|uniref:Uncharacterized protein n=1 Tax=Mollisia scopiformis TaxID=149040 RepID=A0A194XAQ3_MOLSC|nr:uncharacterized protein LY89DRAFT_746753 [Mollisia scopiformis]KUJ17256.1 hypothetical protein LY89DRAFT_746753 [Mollisia scopiformis]
MITAQINLPILGSASPFGCLSLSGITSTGLTSITGDIGAVINPLIGSLIKGFSPRLCSGTDVISAVAAVALTDATAAFTAISSITAATILSGDLGGMTLPPGVYKFASSATLSTTLTLLGTGSSSDAWYFLIGSTPVLAPGSKVFFGRRCLL